MSARFRFKTTELACKGDDLASASPWEASQVDARPSCKQVLASLRAALNRELQGASWVDRINIFLVCEGSEVKQAQVILGDELQGIVVVPSLGDTDMLEKPSQKVFVSDAVSDRLATLSDAQLQRAIRLGDSAAVVQVTTEDGARFLLETSEQDRRDFAEDFAKLQREPEGPWPSSKLMRRLSVGPDGKFPTVLVVSGAMSPCHQAHTMMLWQAKERLERAGFAVLAGWLSPSCEAAAAKEAQDKGYQPLSSAFRKKVAELSTCDDDFVSVGSWELGQQQAARPQELCRELQQYLKERFSASFEGQTVRVFYVCGTDVAERSKLYSGLEPSRETGLVVVERGDDVARLEVPSQLVFVADPTPGEASSFSSTRVREAVKKSDVVAASQELAPATARFALAPTPAEKSEMSADFEALGSKGLEPGDLRQAMGKLKETLRAWAGPQGSVHTDDLSRLLHFIDPSWTDKEMGALLGGCQVSPDGLVSPEEFIDWLFTRCQA